MIFPEWTPATTRELFLLTAVAVVAAVALFEIPEAGGSGRPLLSPAPDITEDLEDLKTGEAGSLGLTSLFSDSRKSRCYLMDNSK